MTRVWSINGRFMSQRTTGVQRYAREVVRALDAKLADGHPLVRGLSLDLLVPPDARDDLPLRSIRVRRVGRRVGHLWEQTVLPRHVRSGLVSLGNSGPLATRRHIVCFHDTTPRDCPESYSVPFRVAQRVTQSWLGSRATQVMTVSQHAADRLAHHGVCAPGTAIVAPDGHEHTRGWEPVHSAATRAVAGLDTVVVIGTPAPHKNVRMLVAAAERLAAAGLRLAVAGGLDRRVFRAQGGMPESPAVIRVGHVGDGELAALLRDSLCLAFPSLHEGFGLPVLEAMALGCPVVASDRAGLPALCGDAALYAAADRPEQWLDAFVRLRADPALRSRQRALGLARATLFSWPDSADRYLAAMAVADGLSPDGEMPAVTSGRAPQRRPVGAAWS